MVRFRKRLVRKISVSGETDDVYAQKKICRKLVQSCCFYNLLLIFLLREKCPSSSSSSSLAADSPSPQQLLLVLLVLSSVCWFATPLLPLPLSSSPALRHSCRPGGDVTSLAAGVFLTVFGRFRRNQRLTSASLPHVFCSFFCFYSDLSSVCVSPTDGRGTE